MKSDVRIICKKGSATVEASLIFPVIFLIGVAIIYFSMILYQKAYIQSLADNASQKGAASWTNPKTDIYTGNVPKASLGDGGLYWRLFDFSSEAKRKKIEEYITNRIAAHAAMGLSKPPVVSVELDNYVVYKVLKINIDVSYKIPVGNLLKMFGLSNEYRFSAKSSAVIHEPAEFIRNTDFVLDTERKFEKEHPKFESMVSKIRTGMNSIKTKIDKFFNKE